MNEHYPFVNPPLPYTYDALEPYIDARTMKLHHDRHLQTYVDRLNQALEKYPEYQSMTLEQLLVCQASLPGDLQTPVQNNGGGVYSHILYFSCLCPPGACSGADFLKDHLAKEYGSLAEFQTAFTEAALSVFGSGYAWLTLNCLGRFRIITTADQDTPFSRHLSPLLNLDVWEHAYYLKHYNDRKDYIADWFRVVNWQQAEENYILCFS